MTTTYFGNCNSDGSINDTPSDFYDNNRLGWITAGYTCPANGTLVELGAYYFTDPTTPNPAEKIRIALYDATGGTKLAETSALSVTASSAAWQVGTIVGGPALTSGTVYIIAIASESANSKLRSTYDAAATNTYSYVTGDYTGGMPTTASGGLAAISPLGTNGSERILRIGIDAAMGGTAPTVTSVTPSSVVPNASAAITLNLALVGTNFDITLSGGAATVTFSDSDVTVNSRIVNSATSITVNITIATAAAPNVGTLTVHTDDGTASSAFSIVAATGGGGGGVFSIFSSSIFGGE